MPTIRDQCDTLADATLALLHPLFSVCVLLLLSIPTQNLNPICQMLGDFILIIVFRLNLIQLLVFVIESLKLKLHPMLAWFILISRFYWHYLNLTWLRVATTMLVLYLTPVLFTELLVWPYGTLHSNRLGSIIQKQVAAACISHIQIFPSRLFHLQGGSIWVFTI